MKTPLIIALGAYIVIIFGFAFYWMRKVKEPLDFLMAGRKLGMFVLLGTIAATAVGTGATLGASGLAYQSGWGGCLYSFGLGLGVILVGLLFASTRDYEFMTLGEEVVSYYGGNIPVYHFANVAIFLGSVSWLGVQIMGAGFYLSILTGLPVSSSIIMSGVVFAVVTIVGGYLTVAYTDVVQVIVLIIGYTILALFSLNHIGGLASLKQSVPASYFSFFGIKELGWMSAISIPLALLLQLIPEPAFRHRMYSASSKKVAKWSMVGAGGFAIIFSVVIAILGMSAYALNPNLAAQDKAIPWLAINVFPLGLAGVVVISGFAATFSSGDSDAAVGGVFFIRHIYPLFSGGKPPRKPLLVTRLALVGMFVVATVLVLQFQTIVDFVVNFISVILSGLAVVILLGKFWKRATWQGAISAIITGAVVSLLVINVPALRTFFEKPVIPATIAALIVEVVVSLLTPADKKSFDEVAEMMKEEREKQQLEVEEVEKIFGG
jgi:SSS family solute:Na+ symporter